MASCSPCRFMFGDYIRISVGMEPMPYPDCERERAGLRGYRVSRVAGAARRAGLRGYRVSRAAGVVRRAVLRGYRVSQAAGVVRRAVLRGYRVSRAAGAARRSVLRGYRVSQAAGVVRRSVLRGYWVSRAAGVVRRAGLRGYLVNRAAEAARPVFRCDLVRRCDLWLLRQGRTRHRFSNAICCGPPLALSRALCRICAATAVRLRTA